MDFARIMALQLDGSLGTLLCCLILGSLVLWLIVGLWVYRDAESRGMSGVLWLLVVLVAGVVWVLIFFFVLHAPRPSRVPPYAPPPPTPTPPARPPPAAPGGAGSDHKHMAASTHWR